MSEHVHDDVKGPARYPPSLRRLQRDLWSREALEWLLRTHRDLPPIVAAMVREKLVQLGQASRT